MNICNHCGKLLEAGFYFCPWWGKSRIEDDSDEAMELKYKLYRENKAKERKLRLDQMEISWMNWKKNWMLWS